MQNATERKMNGLPKCAVCETYIQDEKCLCSAGNTKGATGLLTPISMGNLKVRGTTLLSPDLRNCSCVNASRRRVSVCNVCELHRFPH
jgi:hypothetical protein